MNSFNLIKTTSRALLLTSAALLSHVASSSAADRSADAQTQARELLSRPTVSGSAAAHPSNTASSDAPHAASLDPHEQARRLILGTRNSAGGASDRPVQLADRGDRRGHVDAQAMAQRMILGGAGARRATSGQF
ncbi:MAG TPA: hypothetical protein VNW26_08550 [Steroidobacteraceae bacterium]|nr:hypothetical protein [Steroidobacteraceae bacterium]